MKLFRRNRQPDEKSDLLGNAFGPLPIMWTNPFGSDMIEITAQKHSADRRLPRRCPICLESYQPDAHVFNTSCSDDCEAQAGATHRKHSAATSISSEFSVNTMSIKRDNHSERRSSRFHEHFSRAQTIHADAHDQEELTQQEQQAIDHSLLAISGAAAQQRRRRSAQSCGSDDNEEISIGWSMPREVPRKRDSVVQEEYYHLNGVRMIF